MTERDLPQHHDLTAKLRPAPVWDVMLYRVFKRTVAVISQVTPQMVEIMSEEDLAGLDRFLSDSIRNLDLIIDWRRKRSFGFVSVRTFERQRAELAAIEYAVARGYAPGHVPSRQGREATVVPPVRKVS